MAYCWAVFGLGCCVSLDGDGESSRGFGDISALSVPLGDIDRDISLRIAQRRWM